MMRRTRPSILIAVLTVAMVQPATFGAVFSNVDLPFTTSIQLFGPAGASLGTSFAPAVSGANASFSFFGVVGTAGGLISRVEITTGTTAPGPNDNPSAGVNVVVMDDFLYGEPVAIPEPASLTLGGSAAVIGLFLARLRRWRMARWRTAR